MKKIFIKPVCEVIYLSSSIITDSVNCQCWDGEIDYGAGADETCPNLNSPECGCKRNTTDPNLGNCV